MLNPTGQLNKAVDLTPFASTRAPADGADDPLVRPAYANDVVFGGPGATSCTAAPATTRCPAPRRSSTSYAPTSPAAA